ncbi:alpha/beta hydrolase [Perlucidibaca aquatica]|uniref:alpha/beta hydrolase n=1 Tax=Perlucidibaca aquatica TaxID=1852776 RepID=UPI000AD39D44|nr:alpha/beta hydrolase [Perlucidibaca aquatica]
MAEAIVVSSQSLLPATLAAGEHHLLLTTATSVIELAIHVPSVQAVGLALVCHPHPLMGGTFENKVVTTLARTFRDQRLMAIRFNFRGVGASTGQFDHGQGEQDDALVVMRWAQQQFQLPWRLLAGFSFGAFVALRVHTALASNSTVEPPPLPRLCLVAPPVTRFDLSAASLVEGTEVIYGDADEVVDPQAIAQWLLAAGAGVRITTVPGAGHFFHGQLAVLKGWAQRVCEKLMNASEEQR